MPALQRRKITFPFEAAQLPVIKNKVLEWITIRSGTFLYLDSHGFADPYGRYEMLAATGAVQWLSDLNDLQAHQAAGNGWCFGHLAYDFKNQLFEGLESRHPALAPAYEAVRFFVPETVLYINRDTSMLVLETLLMQNEDDLLAEILQMPLTAGVSLPRLSFQRNQNKTAYLAALAQVQEHIRAGDCYELNYCSSAEALAPGLHPLQVYRALRQKTPAPFSAFYGCRGAYMMGASPERFFAVRNHQLIAQPIKGTAARGRTETEDEAAKESLLTSKKERAENVMIVDLMRNDLARCCEPGTVRVAELFGIYTFPAVHQMISTVTGKVLSGLSVAAMLKVLFPMGSMTGAPKKRVMELTDELETSRRGLYAGTVGYLSPDGDADFNVVIRSLFYDAASGRLSYHSGGAITHQSLPAQEWEELLLKGKALEQLFAG